MGGMAAMLTPLLLHMGITFLVAAAFRAAAGAAGLMCDPALITAVGNLAVIPAAAWLYRRDRAACRTADQPGGRSEKAQILNSAGGCSEKAKDLNRAGGRSEKTKTLNYAGGRQGRNPVLLGVLCFVAGGALNILWSGVLNLLNIQAYFSNEVQAELLASGMAVQALGLGLVVPAAEELVFRALVYRRMKRFFSVRTAAVLSALLFAVYHGNPIQMIFAFPLAVVLALVYERGGSLVFPVLLHAGSNLTAVFLNFFL